MLIHAQRRCFIVDRASCLGMMANNGRYTSAINFCVNFDTQALSYMMQYFLEQKNDNDISDFLCKLASSKMDYTPLPYYIENLGKDDASTRCGTWQSMMLYGFLMDALSENNIKNPPADFYKSEYALKADETYKYMHTAYNDPRFHMVLITQKIIYAILLKCCLLKLANKYSKAAIKEFFDFVAYDVGAFFDREVSVCYLFLSKNDFPLFFKHIKPNAKNILQKIRAMSWDLAHLRTLELMTSLDQNDNKVTFTLHSLMTYDKGLIEIVKALPAKSMVFHKGEYRIFFKHLLPEMVSELDLSEYFTPENKKKREQVRQNLNIDALISELENNICKGDVS